MFCFSDEKRLANRLYKKHRILCMVLTTAKSVDRRDAIIETWGKRCQILLFLIGKPNITEMREINSFARLVTLPMVDHWNGTWTKGNSFLKKIKHTYCTALNRIAYCSIKARRSIKSHHSIKARCYIKRCHSIKACHCIKRALVLNHITLLKHAALLRVDIWECPPYKFTFLGTIWNSMVG